MQLIPDSPSRPRPRPRSGGDASSRLLQRSALTRAGGRQSCGEDERAACTSASTPIPAMPNRSCTHLPLATLFARTHLLRRRESCRPSFCLYTATHTHTSILVSVLPHMRRRRRIHLSYNRSIARSLAHASLTLQGLPETNSHPSSRFCIHRGTISSMIDSLIVFMSLSVLTDWQSAQVGSTLFSMITYSYFITDCSSKCTRVNKSSFQEGWCHPWFSCYVLSLLVINHTWSAHTAKHGKVKKKKRGMPFRLWYNFHI